MNNKLNRLLTERAELDRTLADKLQKSILQEAIQGRLVPQDPTDEPVEKLLERIRAEKKRLVAEGKLKAKDVTNSVIFIGADNRHYEKIGKETIDITDSIPFEIPDSWQWIRGKQMLLPMESKRPDGDYFTYIDVDAVNNKLHVIDNAKTIPVPNAPSRANRKLHNGDVLFSMVRPYLKNIAMVDEEYCNAIASTGFYVLTPSVGVNPNYLFYMMLSSYVVDGLTRFMKGENSPSINTIHIENHLYPLPPYEEQQRIVAKVDELFAKIDGR